MLTTFLKSPPFVTHVLMSKNSKYFLSLKKVKERTASVQCHIVNELICSASLVFARDRS